MSSPAVPPPDQGESPEWADDTKAKDEEKNWENEGALKGQRVKNDVSWLKVYGWLVILVTIILTVLFLITLGVWATHQLTPYSWLTTEQLSNIQSIIFSGSLGAIVSGVLQKQLAK